jgi:hypothetical protein
MYPATPVSNSEGDEEDNQVENWDKEVSGAEKVDRKGEGMEVNTAHPSEPIKPTAMDFDLDGSNGEKDPEINIVEEDAQTWQQSSSKSTTAWDMHLFLNAGDGKARRPPCKAQELPNPNVHGLCIREGEPKGM